MRSPVPLPEGLSGRPLSVTEAISGGIGRERLRRRDLATPFAGVRSPAYGDDTRLLADILADPDSPEYWTRVRALVLARARSYQRRMSDRVVFSHATAAHIHGFYLPSRLATDLTLHVATAVPGRRPRTRGVRSHLVPDGRVIAISVDGLLTTAPLDTWCTLASVLSLDQTVIIADQLMERQHPVATFAELSRAVRSHTGRHGAKLLRAALPLARARTDSPMETQLRLILARAGLPEPLVNHPVLNRFGVELRLGDLVYPRFRVLVEYDGWRHRDDPHQFERDIDRLAEAMEDGWRVIRVHRGMLGDNAHVAVHRVRTALLDQGWRP